MFMEKTFAADPAGCHRIMAAGRQAQERNLKIAAGLQCRHSVARQAMIERVRAGELGEIPLVRATRSCGSNYLAKPPADVDHVAWQIAHGIHFLWGRSGILAGGARFELRFLADRGSVAVWRPRARTARCRGQLSHSDARPVDRNLVCDRHHDTTSMVKPDLLPALRRQLRSRWFGRSAKEQQQLQGHLGFRKMLK